MKKSLCMLGLVLCVGCATAIVRPYVGEQQNWPIASGSIVNTRYDLPIFTSLPSAPYDILAEMRIQSPLYAQPEEGHMPVLVKKAKKIGADALMFVQGQIFFAANYGPRSGEETEAGLQPTMTQVNRFNPESFKPGVTIVAIKWTGEPPPGMAKKEEKKAEEKPEEKKEEAAPEAPATTPAPEQPAAPPAPEAVTPPVTPEATPAPADTNAPPAEVAPAPATEAAPAVTNEPPKEVPPPAPATPEAPAPAEPTPAPAPAEPAPAPANP